MTDATELVQDYRLALRDLWNRYIWSDPALRNTGVFSSFKNVIPPLFLVLVADKIGHVPKSLSHYFGESFTIVPSSPDFPIPEILVDTESNGAFAQILGPFHESGMRLVLVDLYDWQQFGYWDLPYYEVKIEALPGRPDLAGRRGLVDVKHALVMWDETSRQPRFSALQTGRK